MAYVRFKNGVEYRPPNTGVNNNVAGDNFSGSTSETVISQVLIPANTFTTGDMFDVYSLLTKNQTGNITLRLRIGPLGTTADTLVATNTTSTVRTQWVPLFRKFIYLGSTSVYGFSGSTSSPTFVNETGNITTYSLPLTGNTYISVTSEATSTATTVNVKYIKLKRVETLVK